MATNQEIRDAGLNFISDTYYHKNPYTLPTTQASTIGNTGIVNTQAAGSYMGYPSYEAWLLAQGGGGGGNGGGNEIEEDTFSMGMSPGAMGGKLPGVGNWAKRTFGPLAHAYSQLPTPGNLAIRGWKGIQRWRENKKIEKEQNLQEEIRAHNEAAGEKARVATVAQEIQQDIDRGGRGDRPDTGRNAPGGGRGQSPTGGNVAGTPFAQGGRIGYNRGRVVNPGGYQGDEFEDENTLEFMQDQGIPYGEMAETSPFEMRIQELIDTGMSWQEAYQIASEEFGQIAEGPEDSFSQEGIASLV